MMGKTAIYVLTVTALLVFASVGALAANVLADPNMDVGDGPWTRLSAHFWWASWINQTDGQTPTNYALMFKDAPTDNTTQVVSAMGQNLYNPVAGTYEVSIYYRMHPGNPLTMWDGAGGADQWAGLHLDTHNGTNYTTWQDSARIESATTSWTKYTTQFVIPEGTTVARFWMQGIFLESWAMIDWDTASMSLVPEPGSIVVLLSGLAGLAGIIRRRK